MNKKVSSESIVKDIRRRTRKKYSSEEKIHIVLESLRVEENIANLCRCKGISWNQVKSASWEIQPEKPTLMKLMI